MFLRRFCCCFPLRNNCPLRNNWAIIQYSLPAVCRFGRKDIVSIGYPRFWAPNKQSYETNGTKRQSRAGNGHETAQTGTGRHKVARLKRARNGTAGKRHGMAQTGTEQTAKTARDGTNGTSQTGPKWHGTTQTGLKRHDTAKTGIKQHGTAQNGTNGFKTVPKRHKRASNGTRRPRRSENGTEPNKRA